MKSITVKFFRKTLRQLKEEARASGHSVAALIRELVEGLTHRGSRSVYEITVDLAGSVSGARQPATNKRRRFSPSRLAER